MAESNVQPGVDMTDNAAPQSAVDVPETAENGKESTPLKPLVGIDFGTKRSVLAMVHEDNEFLPIMVRNNLANDQTPSIVSFRDRERKIGEEAASQVVSNPKGTIQNVKKLLGGKKDGTEAYTIVHDPITGSPLIQVNYWSEEHIFTPTQIVAMIFSALKRYVEIAHPQWAGQAIDCILAVPGQFTQPEVNALIDAATIAEFNVKSLISESTAASLCYAAARGPKISEEEAKQSQTSPEKANEEDLSMKPSHTVLLLSSGHKFFSVQVARATKEKLEVLSTQYDDTLGAECYETSIYELAREEFKNKAKLDVSTNAKAMVRLQKAAASTKEILSTIPSTNLTCECLMDDRDLSIVVQRSTIDQRISQHLDRIATKINQALEDAKLKLEDLDVVELVGGGMRIPIFQEKVRQALSASKKPLKPSVHLDSTSCVAMGAAMLGKAINPDYRYTYTIIDDQFKASIVDAGRLSGEELQKAQEKNRFLMEKDAEIREITHQKNALESLIYSTRQQMDDKQLEAFVPTNDRAPLTAILRSAEDWLTDEADQADKTQMVAKFNEIETSLKNACPTLFAELARQEEEREKARKEAEEYQKTHENTSSRDDREPRTTKEKIEFAKKRKNQGAVCFNDGDYEGAVLRWTQAIGYLESLFDLNDAQKKEIQEVKIATFCNMAQCYLKLQKYEKARDNCTEVLKVDKRNVKALFRRGQAYYYLKDFENASKDLKEASKLDPKDAAIRKTLQAVQDQLKQQREKDKKFFGRMFG